MGIKEKFINIKPISSNQMYSGSRRKTTKYKDFINEIIVGFGDSKLEINKEDKLELIVHFFLGDNRKDLDNLLKGFIDSLQKHYEFNDRQICIIYTSKTIINPKETKEGILFTLEKF